MTKDKIIAKVKGLGWPQGEYVVFGSCPLAVAGIRESGDIDMLVTDDLLGKLKQSPNWKMLDKGGTDRPLTFDVYEAHNKWDFSSYQPTLEQLLSTADVIDGISFASLDEVRKWKLSTGRPKDLKDIKLIDEYLSKNSQ